MEPLYFNPHSKTNKVETRYHTLSLEDGIVFQTYNSNISRMTIKIAKEIINDRINFCNGQTLPMITDSSNATKLDTDARIYLSSKEAHYLLCAFGLIVKNPFSKLLGSFFLKFEPVTVPAKIFTTKQKAINWIKYFRKLN